MGYGYGSSSSSADYGYGYGSSSSSADYGYGYSSSSTDNNYGGYYTTTSSAMYSMATSTDSAMATSVTMSYGSGSSNWGGSGYNDCVNREHHSTAGRDVRFYTVLTMFVNRVHCFVRRPAGDVDPHALVL